MALELNEEIDIKSEPFEEQHTEFDNNETFGQNTTLNDNEMDTENIEIGAKDMKPFEFVEVENESLLAESVTDNSPTCGKCNVIFENLSMLNYHLLTPADLRPISCPVCLQNFTQKDHLRIHLLTVHKLVQNSVGNFVPPPTSHKCETCHLLFKSNYRLQQHINYVHQSLMTFKCDECGACFKRKSGLNSHLMIHTGERPFKCSICSFQDFRWKHSLKNHLKTVHKIVATADLVQKQPTVPVIIDQTMQNVCEKCNIQFSSHENLSQHVCIIQDNVEIGPFEEHDTEFDSNETIDDPLLELNNELHEEIDIKSETFDEHNTELDSNETFGQNTTLSDNEMDTDNIEIGVEDVKPFDIFEVETESLLAEPVTDNSLMRQSSLNDNLLSPPNNEEDTSHFCKLCDKTYKTKQDLEKHVQLFHQGIKPYKCEICSKCFTFRSSLRAHFTIHSGEKPYQCSKCSESFRKNDILKNHFMNVHNQQTETRNGALEESQTHQTPNFCKLCDKAFKSKQGFNGHIQSFHNSLRPFQCTICKIRFALKGSLNTHLTIHSGEKPYQCSKCGKAFRLKVSLNEHLCNDSLHNGIFKKIEYRSNILEDAADKIVPNKEPVIIVQKEHKVCEKCNAQLSLRKNRKQHLCAIQNNVEIGSEDVKPFEFVEVKTEPVTCGKCNEEFSSLENLQQHEQSIHENIICSICNESFNDHSNLKHHLLIHTKVKHYPCSLCSLKFALKLQLKNHLQQNHKLRKSKIHNKASPTPIVIDLKEHTVCKICNIELGSIENLNQHMCTIHGNVEFKCTKCSASFNNQARLNCHLRNHTMCTLIFTCVLCNRNLASKYSLKGHLIKIHNLNENDEPLKCLLQPPPKQNSFIVCGPRNTYESKQGVTIQKRQFKQRLQQFQCNICSKRCTTQAGLNLHLTLHSGKKPFKPFKCPKCGKYFRLRMNLRVHLCIVHYLSDKLIINNLLLNSIKCPSIDKIRDVEPNSNSIQQNVNTVHKDVRQFKCSTCHKDFTSRTSLIGHLRTHENTELNLTSGLQHSPPKLHHSMARNKVRQTDCKLAASSHLEKWITKVKPCCVLLDRGEVTRYLSRLDKREVTEERGSPIEGLPPSLATPAPPVRDDPIVGL